VKYPRLALLLLGTALAAWLAGTLYTWFLDPEMKFWASAAGQKLDWVDKMREKHGYVIGVVGGSTTTFGIDAEYIERAHSLPVANLGLHFGMGPACIGFGLSALREGDVLVLSLEPAMLTAKDTSVTPLGSKLSSLLGKPEINSWVDGRTLPNTIEGLSHLQPGGYHAVTIIGKLALGQPLYRYSMDNLRPGGLQITSERRDLAAATETATVSGETLISPAGEELLQRAKIAAEREGLKVIFLLPWSYSPPQEAENRRKANDRLLGQISEIMPVLRESQLGVHEKIDDFSDTGQHLTENAARMRSRLFAENLLDSNHFEHKPER
jgi:hypothetical protein